MPLIKKNSQQTATYSLNLPQELINRIEKVHQIADSKDMVFDLDSTVRRVIRAEVSSAETALGMGSKSVKRKAIKPTADPVS